MGQCKCSVAEREDPAWESLKWTRRVELQISVLDFAGVVVRRLSVERECFQGRTRVSKFFVSVGVCPQDLPHRTQRACNLRPYTRQEPGI